MFLDAHEAAGLLLELAPLVGDLFRFTPIPTQPNNWTMVQLNTERRITPKKEVLNHSRGIPHLVKTDNLVARIRRDPADFDNVEGLAEDVMAEDPAAQDLSHRPAT